MNIFCIQGRYCFLLSAFCVSIMTTFRVLAILMILPFLALQAVSTPSSVSSTSGSTVANTTPWNATAVYEDYVAPYMPVLTQTNFTALAHDYLYSNTTMSLGDLNATLVYRNYIASYIPMVAATNFTALYHDYVAPVVDKTASLFRGAPAAPAPTLVPYDHESLQRALWNAVSIGNATLTEDLLVQGANPNELHYGRSYIEIAAQNSLTNRVSDLLGFPNPWVSVIKTLVRYGANPYQMNYDGLTPYEQYKQGISWYPNKDVQRLLTSPVRSHTSLQNLLRFAVCEGNPERVAMRIEQGADPRELSYGSTFLELAAMNSRRYPGALWADTIRVLMANDADVRQVNEAGRTARDVYSAQTGVIDLEVAQLLEV